MKNKRLNFREKASLKVNKILKLLDELKELSNKRLYEYTKDEIEKIEKALIAGVDGMLNTFQTCSPYPFTLLDPVMQPDLTSPPSEDQEGGEKW